MIKLLQITEEILLRQLEKVSPRLFRLADRYKIYFKYLISGGVAAGTDLLLLAFFKEFLGMNYLVAAALAFIIAFGVSFSMQKFWTFGDNQTDGVHRQAFIYFAVAVANLAVNTFMMYIFVDKIHIWYLLSQVVASGAIAVYSFAIYQLHIFNLPKSS